MWICADCQREMSGRTYGLTKYGLMLCSRCFRDRNERAHPETRDHRLHYMRAYFRRRHPRSATRTTQPQPVPSGGWTDPEVRDHHAAMLHKYFQSEEYAYYDQRGRH